MHKSKKDINVFFLGREHFINSIIELKDYLDFNFKTTTNILNKQEMSKFDILLIHEDFKITKNDIDLINDLELIKLVLTKDRSEIKIKDKVEVKIPLFINEINKKIIETFTKKKFAKNSSVVFKDYILDKNEKKLKKNNEFIIITEKEINLLELLLSRNKPITKNEILKTVWKYADDADTHTVETHVYRLRKKIKDKFLDEKFIINNNDGYFI